MGLIGNSILRFIRAEEGDKVENFYDSPNYDRGNYHNSYRSNSGDRRIEFSGQNRGRPSYEQNYKAGNFRGNVRMY